ncbi:MAG: hypothetical protein ACQESG_03880 [Nanobdellota archaeon]
MFELMKAQLSTLLLTKRRMLRKTFRLIRDQPAQMQKLEEEKGKLDTDINTGDVDAVRKDFEQWLKTYKKAVEDSFRIEKFNILFVAKEGTELKNQQGEEDDVKRLILKMHANDSVFPVSYGRQTINNTQELQEVLKQKYRQWTKKLNDLHERESQNEAKIVNQLLDQSRNMQHLRDEVFNNFAKYETEQEVRRMKREVKHILNDMKQVHDDEKELEKSFHFKSKEEIQKLLEEFDKLISDTDKEVSESAQLIKIHSMINLLAIYEYFELVNKYESNYIENELIPRLKKEGYPETQELVKELQGVAKEIKEEATETRNTATRVQQQNS